MILLFVSLGLFCFLILRNLLVGDTFSGCWATVGVLTEKGVPRTSSTGKGYCIWKIGCLDEATISLFLFGDAYKQFCNERAGTAFAFFNCTVRKDSMVNTQLSFAHILLFSLFPFSCQV